MPCPFQKAQILNYHVTFIFETVCGNSFLFRGRRWRSLHAISVIVDHPGDARVQAVNQHEDVAQVFNDEQRQLVVKGGPEIFYKNFIQ